MENIESSDSAQSCDPETRTENNWHGSATETRSSVRSKNTKNHRPSTRAIRIIENVHDDDVHILRIVPKPTEQNAYANEQSNYALLSGSKDCTVKLWSIDGQLLHTVRNAPRHNERSEQYKQWVCCVGSQYRHSIFGDSDNSRSRSDWYVGFRDGLIERYTASLNQLDAQLRFQSPHSDQKCKVRNMDRVLCIEPYRDDYFLIGSPKTVSLYDMRTNHCVTSIDAHRNDWIYCIRKYSEQENRFLVVIGGALELWDMNDSLPLPNRSSENTSGRQDIDNDNYEMQNSCTIESRRPVSTLWKQSVECVRATLIYDGGPMPVCPKKIKNEWAVVCRGKIDKKMYAFPVPRRGKMTYIIGNGGRTRSFEPTPQDQSNSSNMQFSSRDRPYISNIAWSPTRCQVAACCFDGRVRLVTMDRLYTNPSSENYEESSIRSSIYAKCHRGRVWDVSYRSEHEVLTSGEDGYIRLWDTRCPLQVQRSSNAYRHDATLTAPLNRAQLQTTGHCGRVSQFQLVDSNNIVSVACPMRCTDQQRANMYFWDLRTL